jgi:hypothetical protein
MPMRGAPADVPEIRSPDRLVTSCGFAEADHWYACGPPPQEAQGWKLYVPMTMLTAAAMTRELVPLVTAAGLHVKYVRSIDTLRKLNAGLFGYSQIGKCLVVYLPQLVPQFLEALTAAVTPWRDQCPAVPFARPFGNRLPLYYRYGAYRGNSIRVRGRELPDDRSTTAVPEGIPDELRAFTTAAPEDDEVTNFLRQYPTFRAITQQGKCGIFHAMDLSSPTFREVVLKAGYHRGQVQIDGSDGCDFLRREIAAYRLLADRGLDTLAPRLVAVLDRPRKVILALEYVDGMSMLHRNLRGELTVDLLDRAWAILDQIHAGGMYLGDAKLANFLATDDDDLRVVDFEAAGMIGDRLPPVRTFLLEDEPDDPFAADRAHFLASVLFPYEAGRYSWNDRRVSLTKLRLRPAQNDVTRWALARLDTEPTDSDAHHRRSHGGPHLLSRV